MSKNRMRGKKKSDGSGERASMKEILCKTLDIQPDTFRGETLIELRGRNKLVVRGGGDIALYTPDKIVISVRDGKLCICGKRLFCSSFRTGTAEIDGEILSLVFEEEE